MVGPVGEEEQGDCGRQKAMPGKPKQVSLHRWGIQAEGMGTMGDRLTGEEQAPASPGAGDGPATRDTGGTISTHGTGEERCQSEGVEAGKEREAMLERQRDWYFKAWQEAERFITHTLLGSEPPKDNYR